MTMNAIENENKVIQQKLDLLNPPSSSSSSENEVQDEASKNDKNNDNDDFDLDGDWGDDDDENDELIQANKKRQEEKEKLAQEVARASGKNTDSMLLENVKIEGVDDGVLGQKWVEGMLASVGLWPPVEKVMEVLGGGKGGGVEQKELNVWIEENKAVRRNVCMTLARLNSQILNTHPELGKIVFILMLCACGIFIIIPVFVDYSIK